MTTLGLKNLSFTRSGRVRTNETFICNGLLLSLVKDIRNSLLFCTIKEVKTQVGEGGLSWGLFIMPRLG